MKELIPAVMAKTFESLKDQMSRVVSLVPYVQIDVMDGKFVDAKSWPFSTPNDKEFLKIIQQEEGFPFWEELNFEADLMVADPHTEADRWVAAGATRIVIHYLSTPFERLLPLLSELKEKGIETGIAFVSKTSQEEVEKCIETYKEYIHFVQCMGIKNVGHQKEPFDETVIERIKALKQKFPDLLVSVDGGVHLDTAQQLVDAGADRLVAGSAIFEAHEEGVSLEQTIEQFDEILKIS